MGGSNYTSVQSAETAEALRLERTRPRMPTFATDLLRQAWFDRLPRGDRVMCNVICAPNAHGQRKGRRSYHATRVVDRKIWAKLNDHQRGQWIDRIRAEVGA